MAHLQEKRNHVRRPCRGRITLRYTQRDSSPIDAGLIDVSRQGLRFYSHRPLTPGTTVLFRTSADTYRDPDVDAAFQLRSTGLVTIKWCRSETRQGRPVHCMGAVYMIHF